MAAFRCACLFLLLSAGVAGADEFSEFRIPEHRWRSLRGDASFSGFRDRQNDPFTQRRSDNWSALLGGSGNWAHEADDRQWLVSFSADVADRVGDVEGRSRVFGVTDVIGEDLDSRFEDARERFVLGAEFERYPESIPVGLSVGVVSIGDFAQDWNNSRRDQFSRAQFTSARSLQESNSQQVRYTYQVQLTSSVGVGRVRNATGVYSAYLLERRLRADGVITGSLSAAARERIAGLYYVYSLYRQAHDRPEKFFWRDLERILRDEGVLASGSMDAYGLLHALEPYVPGGAIAFKRSGQRVAVAVTYDHRHSIRRVNGTTHNEDYIDDVLVSSSTVSNGVRLTDDVDRVLFGPEAQACLPLGWRWQVDAAASAQFDAKGPGRGTTVQSQLQAGYLIAERWQASAFLAQRRDTGDEGLVAREGWGTSAGIDVAYDIEDHIQAVLSITDFQSRYDMPGAYFRNQRLSLGLSYLFSGGLDAPGLIEPVRPLRGGTLNP